MQACCCTLTTIHMPKSMASFCGQTSVALCCCFQDEYSACILPEHQDYDSLLQGDKENVLCICTTGETAVVKPLCLRSERPCVKGVCNSCCCTNRAAIPSDADVPCMFAAYALKCCDLFPFAFKPGCLVPAPPLAAVSRPESVEVEQAKIDDLEYLLCAFGCGMCTMYVPNSYVDAFGFTDRSLCCMTQSDTRGCMLPAVRDGYEILLVRGGQVKCIKPPILQGGPMCKGVSRSFCFLNKFAFPCDDEVPFALGCCGTKCAEKVPGGQVVWCKDERIVDPATGKMPLFPPLAKPSVGSVKMHDAGTGLGSPSLKISTPSAEPEAMER